MTPAFGERLMNMVIFIEIHADLSSHELDLMARFLFVWGNLYLVLKIHIPIMKNILPRWIYV